MKSRAKAKCSCKTTEKGSKMCSFTARKPKILAFGTSTTAHFSISVASQPLLNRTWHLRMESQHLHHTWWEYTIHLKRIKLCVTYTNKPSDLPCRQSRRGSCIVMVRVISQMLLSHHNVAKSLDVFAEVNDSLPLCCPFQQDVKCGTEKWNKITRGNHAASGPPLGLLLC